MVVHVSCHLMLDITGETDFGNALTATGTGGDALSGAGGNAVGGNAAGGNAGGGNAGGGNAVGGNAAGGNHSGGGGMAPRGFNNDLVVRYSLDEAASGTLPATIYDYAPNPAHLTLAYGGNTSFTEVAGNRGLEWKTLLAAGLAKEVSPPKLQALTKSATIEVVVQLDAVATQCPRFFAVSQNKRADHLGRLDLCCANDSIELRINNKRVIDTSFTIDKMRHVIHAVVDSNQPNSNDRVEIYIDGVALGALNNDNSLGLREDIIIGDDSVMVIGNRTDQDRSIKGRLFYVAVYHQAFGAMRAQTHAAYLASDDDIH
jgi:hypothetical protein